MKKNKTDPRILALCERVTGKRPKTVIEHILKYGEITTDELKQKYGYDHPPRAIRDVRENGIPLETFRKQSPTTGRMIAAYRFGDPTKIVAGRIGGRSAFSKQFRETLIQMYDSRDGLTGTQMEPRYLQIDHRVPYGVAGDASDKPVDPNEFMLLDASSQRAKSWSCEHCTNWREVRDESICRSCYWAFPEKHSHVAGKKLRRADVLWLGEESAKYDSLAAYAREEGVAVAEAIKLLVDRALTNK